MTNLDNARSSRSKMFFKIGVLKNLVMLTGKYLCWSLFLIKAANLKACNLLKRLQHRCFPVNIEMNIRISPSVCNVPWTHRVKFLQIGNAVFE